CFADERVFRPADVKQPMISYMPRKRASEAEVIQNLFQRFHPRHRQRDWRRLENTPEPAVARAFGDSDLFLSLSRMESVGMTPLEAMASGCICAGFTGVGGQEYATPDNGFWVPED